MDDILIPKDFKDYEPKLIGSFTVRQTLLAAPAFGIAVLMKNSLSSGLFIVLTMLIFSLVWALGWTKPYNMKFEEFVATSFMKMFMSPQKRKYKTENLHRVILDVGDKQQRKQEKDEAKKAKSPKNKKVKKKDKSK